MERVGRPRGITILAILQIIIGVAFLLAGLGSLGLAALTKSEDAAAALGERSPDWLVQNYELSFGIFGMLLLTLAVVAFSLAYGFVQGRGWSWTLGLGFAALDIIGLSFQPLSSLDMETFFSTAVSLSVPVGIVYYLTRFPIKAYFGKV